MLQKKETDYLEPIFGTRAESTVLPKHHLAQKSVEPRITQ
ncbi:hypothetical protein A5821_002848 [Enterococcus sp. 7F3_DIV0205]|uniref:Uncharacterized protein n=1 Tax=Candidatus Enterococcus palustris TaxID=1834189 RepID=A0AAQ3WD04_9ENTE|nr:hypothetical protein A5821_003205 [Enterococcus sp. 7F3_DIV0205]